jgi:hypothetical protein
MPLGGEQLHPDTYDHAKVQINVTVTRLNQVLCCSKIAEAEAAVSVQKWLVMHMHVQLKLPPGPEEVNS